MISSRNCSRVICAGRTF